MTVEWTTDSIHCGLLPGVLLADFKFICSWVHFGRICVKWKFSPSNFSPLSKYAVLHI